MSDLDQPAQAGELAVLPRHLGIIMDGNGRWAQKRGLPRSAGHRAGVQKVREVTGLCADAGIHTLTLYAFSTENWNRPAEEIQQILWLAERYAEIEIPEMQRSGVRLQLMGRREGLPESLLAAMNNSIEQTRDNSRLILNIALNYGGRVEIVDAVRSILADGAQADALDEDSIARRLYCPESPDIDLVIRTGGEWRLSNFMLWQTANSAFYSTPTFWPDFQKDDLGRALKCYAGSTTALS